ncbi:MAG TPA: GTP-binding protein, partial [Spirochaetota bacterium]|nr:GTP-binding protein [Spirochaetota bacterium]
MNTPSSELAKIVITGIVNAGKSSLINSIFEREISIVAPVEGTTTDAVTKRIELASAGPVTVVDTAGLDDKTELGSLRIKKTLNEIETSDIIILATPLNKAPTATEDEILLNAERQNKQILICATFADLPHDESKIKWLTGKSHIRTDNKETNTAAEIRKKLITAA